jgi:phosphatidylinositol-3-phosphatase
MQLSVSVPAALTRFWLSVVVLLLGIGCGGGSSNPTAVNPPGTATPSSQFGHVVLVVEENQNYSQVVGNATMPYLNGLIAKYGLATQYYANTHPSIGNYFMLTAGQLITSDDTFTGVVNDDNIVRELLAAGKTWKSYAEGLPSVGYTGADVYPYVKRHNILAFFSDVIDSSTQVNNLVPFSEFSTDVSNGSLPNFSFVVPNLLDDAHDGPLPAADVWLAHNIDPLISSPAFQKDGLLIIVFDEAGTDSSHGGGRVAVVIISPKAKAGYQSTTLYQHQSTLRLILKGLGITTFPGASAQAPDMSEFF